MPPVGCLAARKADGGVVGCFGCEYPSTYTELKGSWKVRGKELAVDFTYTKDRTDINSPIAKKTMVFSRLSNTDAVSAEGCHSVFQWE